MFYFRLKSNKTCRNFKLFKLWWFQGALEMPRNASKFRSRFPEKSGTETEQNQSKQAKMRSIFSGEWSEIDAKTNETSQNRLFWVDFSRRTAPPSRRLETPRNFSVIFLVSVFCVFSFPVTLRNFTNWILRLFEVFAISVGEGLEKGIWFFSGFGLPCPDAGLHPKGPKLVKPNCFRIINSLAIIACISQTNFVTLPLTVTTAIPTIATTVAVVACSSLPISLPLSPSHPPISHLMPFFPHLSPLSSLMPLSPSHTLLSHCPSPSSSLCPSILYTAHPSFSLSDSLSLPLHLSLDLSVCLSVYLLVSLSLSLYLARSLSLSHSLSVRCFSIYICICSSRSFLLSLSLSLW